ncbi:MAG: type I-E CRISPR-associated endonuclease Cas1e [candidate division Zixibacteria bacterium]|nr:type I-E CRISPR-associated endonuclease Cas1e [candidate division Zixibacteria bacterium]
MLPRLKPIPVKERVSVVHVEKGRIDLLDGSVVVIDKNGVRTHLPIGSIACLMLETGTRISHRAVMAAARVGTLLLWIGDGGVRVYAAGQPGGARSDRLLHQAALALDESARLRVARKMLEMRWGEPPPQRRSLVQLRGLEGARVRRIYEQLARKYRISWDRRRYDPKNWSASNLVNRCVSSATASLYGVTEAAVLAAGYAPAIGFIHTGKPLSFVYDVADIYKFDTVVPLAFSIAAKEPSAPESAVRVACRDMFRETRLLLRIIPDIETILAAGGIPVPQAPDDSQPPAFEEDTGIGDPGHRG